MAMTAQPGGGPGPQGSQVWEAGQRALLDGWRQAQEFWSNAARGWGEVAGAWLGQAARPGQAMSPESAAALRELQEAAFAVAQAWMRLPLVLSTGRPPFELQDALTQLAQAQGRAYQLWLEALTRTGAFAAGAEGGATRPGPSQKQP
jgi:hypothetical protein